MRDAWRHFIAEFIGTFALVFVGSGAIIHARTTGSPSGLLEIALAHGLILAVMVSALMRISGHFNPAVTLGMLATRRIEVFMAALYVIAQVLGAIAGAAVLYLILSGKASGWTGSLGQNGWGPGYLGEYNATAAFVYEVAGTFLFLVCILGVTQRGAELPGRLPGERLHVLLAAGRLDQADRGRGRQPPHRVYLAGRALVDRRQAGLRAGVAG